MTVMAAASPIPPLRKKSMILTLTSALLLLLSSSLGESTNPNYLACKEPTKFSCGGTDYNISYPFWAPGRDKNCSYPGFHLICSPNNSMLIINIGSIADDYQVKNIDYDNRVLTVFDADLVGVSCPASFSHATLNLTLFELGDADANLTLYKCSVDILSILSSEGNGTLVIHRIPCDVSESPSTSRHHTSSKNSYYSVEPVPEPDSVGILGKCDVGVIPMKRMAMDSLEAGDLEFAEAVGEGFEVTWLVGKDWCKGCVESGGACGYDSNTHSDRTCFCPNWNSTNGACTNSNSTNGAFRKDVRTRSFFRRRSVIGAIAGLSSLILLSLSFLVYSCRSRKIRNCIVLLRSNPEKGRSIESFLEKYGSIAPKRYTYSEVKKITKSFGDKLGEGGFGVVYKGSLNGDYPVAVKVLDATKTDGGEDFINEIASIGRTSHVNVVSLLGFCYEGSKRALVYDFMPNGSLDRFIYPERSEATITPLGWENLFKIALGIARGLEYLHQGCNTRIVHFDIKPHNILLDQDLCPKISDFGLAKLCKPKESVISMCGARGTAGYIAPEVFSRNFGVVSSKSDVYSYGMMVLEMVGGRKMDKNLAGHGSESEVYFPHWIYRHLDRDGEDLKSWCGVTSETEGVARKMILVGLWCIQPRPVARPSISRVLEMLEGSIGDLEMPPEPYLSSPVRTPIGSLSVSLLD